MSLRAQVAKQSPNYMSLRASFAKQSPVKRDCPIDDDRLFKRRLLRPDKSIRDDIAKNKSAPRNDIWSEGIASSGL